VIDTDSPVRIGSRLVAAGVVATEMVEEALRAQVVVGGRIGTCLIERRMIRIDDMAHMLATQHGLPAARTEHFENSDRQIQEMLSPEIAAHWHAVPLGRIASGELAVATTDPLPDDGVAELSSALKEPSIVVAIAPELRILYWLEKVYGIMRSNRYRRTAPVPTLGGSHDERRNYVATLGSGAPLQAPGALAKIAVRRIAVSTSSSQIGIALGTMPIAAVEMDAPDVSQLDGAMRALRRAHGRDKVGDIVVDALAKLGDEALEVGILVILRDSLALAWKGFVRGRDDDWVETLAIPLHEPCAITAVCASRTPIRGVREETPLDRALWKHLGTPPPADVIILPIAPFDYLSGVLYAHSREPFSDALASDITELGQAMNGAFERLVRAAQR
jgi:hypothetical protein